MVLPLSLNNCLRRQQPLTMSKQLNSLLKTAEETFPKTLIYIPVINYSDWTGEENNALPKISPLRFKTESCDPIHWTRDTGTLSSVKHAEGEQRKSKQIQQIQIQHHKSLFWLHFDPFRTGYTGTRTDFWMWRHSSFVIVVQGSYGIAEYIDYYLNSVSQHHPSHVKDT